MASSLERLHIDMYQLIDDYMEQRKFSRAATAAFTGHRFVDAAQREHVKKRLSNAVLDAYGHGIRNFISGFAIGFDMMAAEAIVSLKRSSPDITLSAAIPFKGQQVLRHLLQREHRSRAAGAVVPVPKPDGASGRFAAAVRLRFQKCA